MDNFIPIIAFPEEEQNRLRWLVRQHADEMIEAGVALKYGREWRIDRNRLPEVLTQITKKSIDKRKTRKDQ